MAWGCLSESHPPGDPVALERFCDSFFDAVCTPLEACSCGAAVLADCRSEERALCADFPSDALVTAIDEGRLTYDPMVAAALLARLRGRGCEGFVASLDWRVRDLFDLGGTFVGQRRAGEPCTSLGFELISECSTGSCLPTAGGDVCRESVDEGAACDRTHQCVDLDADLQTGGSIDRLVLRCETPTGEDVGVCRSWTAEGGACATEGECWTSRCEGDVCVSVPADGACLSSRECAAGLYCSSLTCVPGGAPDGAPCDDDAACASRVCAGSACRPAGCDLF
ncbi:MAG: hypothetical protein H6719_27965 [Sandaracinaceae bacterium]|nr:hypothetical protein [Sandaracinaceae bacterium]